MFTKNSSFNVLYISDVAATHEFYKSIDAEIKQVESDKVVVGLGDFDLHFVLDTAEQLEDYQFVTKSNGRGMGNLFYLEVENIEQAYNSIAASSGNIITEIKDNHWNGREFMFEDPDGYKFVAYKMKS